jgi:hypothetical protein
MNQFSASNLASLIEAGHTGRALMWMTGGGPIDGTVSLNVGQRQFPDVLHWALWGEKACVPHILARATGLNLETPRPESLWTPLHLAIRYHPDLVPVLIGAGSNVNAKDKNGWAPLNHVLINGFSLALPGTRHGSVSMDIETSLRIFRLLVEAGADVDGVDHEGRGIEVFFPESDHASLALHALVSGVRQKALEQAIPDAGKPLTPSPALPRL